MGGSLSPVLANIFMAYHEEKWLEQCPIQFKPIFYRRYVDDTFLLFKNINHIPLFEQYMNSKHPNITFTSEIESDNRLPFIGVNVMHENQGFTTCVYRKPTDTGLGLNYLSFISSSFKPNSILTLLHRCYCICSSWPLFNKEVEFLHQYYTANRFPSSVFWLTVRKFRNRILTPANLNFDVPKDKQYISLPFYGYPSYRIRNKLLSLFRIHFPQVDVKIVLSNNFTIGSFFRVKEHLPTLLCSNVIYRYQCDSGDCASSYVGSTERVLRDRICEHMNVSNRTGNTLASEKYSSIREHSTKCSHPINDDSFRIIGRCRKGDDLRLLESVFIRHLKPNLNNTESAVALHII